MARGESHVGLAVHVGLAAVPVALALVVACSSGDDTSDEAPDGANVEAGADADAGTTTTEVEDFEMQPDDFVALEDMTAVGRFFVDNKLGHLDEAIAVAENPEGGVYPVGTVIQLVPTEAMVKRAPGFAPAANDWEFFDLEVSAEGTEILTRGGAEVVNRFELSCLSCHSLAEPEFDLVCGTNDGCDPLPPPLDDPEVIRAVQESDPRPTSSG